ncbi:hypothetical protein AABB24_016986 [Solanum stoloniferum]|uniref:Mannitol dehydrogenase n=1 Tax=Solanum stoloniferum TaxID=62892 RepID=A0ABD2TIM1_9SOLN
MRMNNQLRHLDGQLEILLGYFLLSIFQEGRQVKMVCNSKLCIVEFVILIFIKSRMNGASPNIQLYLGRKLVGGSAIGGVKEIQEMVYFAEKHNITPNVEVLPMEYVNTAVERLVKSDVKYRFVLDIGNTLKKS